ncbi:hypothetical protein TWF696_005050 [Orbilia brochopaga]|uniref:Uncharacterized protein n=1 Tax=Orbilia brochopaga TaxID=3140254 RepID=A0AAV9V0S9_9PEZI
MSMTLRKLRQRAAAVAAAEDEMEHQSHVLYPDAPAVRSKADLSSRIHKIEMELAHLPQDSPLRPNFQATLKDLREKGEADLVYQNGRAVRAANVDLRRGPLFVERCSISIMSDDED